MFTYLWERDKGRVQAGKTGRKEDTELNQAPGSWLLAISTQPNMELELTNSEILTRAKVRPFTDWATQAPQIHYFSYVSHNCTQLEYTYHMAQVMIQHDLENKFSYRNLWPRVYFYKEFSYIQHIAASSAYKQISGFFVCVWK